MGILRRQRSSFSYFCIVRLIIHSRPKAFVNLFFQVRSKPFIQTRITSFTYSPILSSIFKPLSLRSLTLTAFCLNSSFKHPLSALFNLFFNTQPNWIYLFFKSLLWEPILYFPFFFLLLKFSAHQENFCTTWGFFAPHKNSGPSNFLSPKAPREFQTQILSLWGNSFHTRGAFFSLGNLIFCAG